MATGKIRQCPHYRIAPPGKYPPGRQLTGKNPPRPETDGRDGFLAITRRPGERKTFLKGDPIMGKILWGQRYFKKKIYQFRDYFSLDGFFMGRHFNVTPAVISEVQLMPRYNNERLTESRRATQLNSTHVKPRHLSRSIYHASYSQRRRCPCVAMTTASATGAASP